MQIEEESDKIWKFQRYNLVFEYFHKPIFPAPFVVIFYLKLLVKLIVLFVMRVSLNKETIMRRDFLFYVYNKCRMRTYGFCMFSPPLSVLFIIQWFNFMFDVLDHHFVKHEDKKRIVKWENYVIDELMLKREKENKNSNEYKLCKNLEK